ncbi:MAG: ABC transporter permease subunit [Chloroflexi bacterium]|nr:ABC transporter permease subunit [Chloroflexota bacterium]
MANRVDTIQETAYSGVRRKALSRRTRRSLAFYGFIAPWLIGFILLTVIPLALGFLASLTNYDGLNLDHLRFLGLQNYLRIFQDRDALYSLGRTVIWTAITVPTWLISAFALALLLDRSFRRRGLLRTLFYLPSIIPLIGVIWIWIIILDTDNGLINGLINLVFPGTAIRWLGGDLSILSMTMVFVWASVGVGMIIFLAGLQNIPAELKEAAQIDGANGWQIIRHITLPLMTPIIFFQLILAIIRSFQQFSLPILLSGGQLGSMPPRSMYLYMIHVNRQIFVNQRFGYGIALLFFMFLIIVLLTLVLFWSTRYWVFQEAEPSRPAAGGN